MNRSARTRRAAAACAVVALAVAAPVVSAAGPAAAAKQAAQGQVAVAITSLSPQIAVPHRPVTISGTVTNATRDAVSGLSVQIRSSGSPLTSRGDLANYADGSLPADSPVAGVVARLPGPLRPGGTERWAVSLRPGAIGMTSFGVYPLAAEVDETGLVLDTDRSFLPFWPGKSASPLAAPIKIAWIWPLIDRPHQAACTALLGNDLAASLAPRGRLGGLLAAGAAAPAAELTWAIDPALVSSAKVMTHGYRVGGSATCGGATGKPASAAARSWLARLRSVTAQQDFFTTPYADVDVAALAHRGMDPDLSRAFRVGRARARELLGSTQRPAATSASGTSGNAGSSSGIGGIAWPAGGIADYGVLGSLAVDGIGTVILNSTMMPPVSPVPYTPSAVTQTPDGVGPELHVALADDTLTQILGSAPTARAARSAGESAAGSTFGTEQRFLAETAMMAAEVPALQRSLVVAPPREWNPAPGLASALLTETVGAPWLQPASLSGLVTANSSTGQVQRQQAQAQVSTRELRPYLLKKIRALDARIRLHGAILTPPDATYLSTAVAAIESSAWRGANQARQAKLLLRRVSAYLTSQEQQVKIIDASQDTLGGKSGPVPVSISNKLDQPVTVRLRVQAPSSRRIVILPANSTVAVFTVTIGAHQQRTVSVRVKAAAAGSTTLRLSLLTPGGEALPGKTARLTVDATHFGTLALVIIALALGVFVLTAIGRAIRRGRGPGPGAKPADPDPEPAQDANGADPADEPDETDTVVQEPADRDRREEPDEYASAPGRADRP